MGLRKFGKLQASRREGRGLRKFGNLQASPKCPPNSATVERQRGAEEGGQKRKEGELGDALRTPVGL